MSAHHGCRSRAVTRRDLLKKGAFLPVAGSALACAATGDEKRPASSAPVSFPLVVSTWPFGLGANQKAMEVLGRGGSVLDAVERGVNVVEADPKISSVGLGGTPDAEGVVTLDASIMNGGDLSCGGVGALRNILHPVSVARKVMEKTPHVLLVGEGALAFARKMGFEETELLTPEARARWEKWKETASSGKGGGKGPQAPDSALRGHDTIGMIALDAKGNLAAAVTTSGLAFKVPGRVGDSPLVGAGIYADRAAGAAVATGVGEEAIRVLGSFLVVEEMRRGASPLEAVTRTLERVKDVQRRRGTPPFQLAFLALSPGGEVAGAALRPRFSYAFSDGAGRHELRQGVVV